MEIINVIFEKYGGKQIIGIFQYYFTLALLLKQFVFSIFIIPADQPAVQFIKEEKNVGISSRAEIESPGEELNRFHTLQLMLTLAQFEMEKEGLSTEDIIQK